ncbi:MAG TPA: ATP synthase F0 subunit B [Terriglobales bacterium]|nr:ATP synthase F0 subunit B [Terriglobales bacterium]
MTYPCLPRRSQRFRLLCMSGVALLILGLGPQTGASAWWSPQAAWPVSNDHQAVAPGPAPESPEGAGESSTSELKHSASVRFISRLTGLSLENSYWFAMVMNFAIVVGVIVWATKKNLMAMFRNRTALIQKAMEEARRASEEANRRMREVEARLSKLDAELRGMRDAAEKEAFAEEQRIQAAAAEDARRMVAAGEQEIMAALRDARRELKGYAADLAVSLAKKQIHVDAATDEELVHSFAQRLATEEGRHHRQ